VRGRVAIPVLSHKYPKWEFYQNVILMRSDCGKNPILSSVYLSGSHHILPSQWPWTNCDGTAKLLMSGPLKWTWHETSCGPITICEEGHCDGKMRWDPVTVGTIDLDTNSSEPTCECGLGNRENPSEPTTPPRARSTEKWKRVKYVVPCVDLNFLIFRISWPLMKNHKIQVNHISWPLIKNQKIDVNHIS